MRRSLSADALFRDALETFRRKGSSEMLEEAFNHVSERVREARSNVWSFEITPVLRRPYILSHYRRDHDLKACVRSLLTLHNETVNVWSHLVGGALFAFQLYQTATAPCDEGEAACTEKWPLYVFLISALLCLSLSAVYHLCGTANERWTNSLANMDYVGIVALIVGSCMPVVWFGFGPVFPLHRAIYLYAIILLGAAVVTCSFTSWFDRSYAHVALFFALAAAGVLAICHAILLHDFNPAIIDLLRGVVQMGLTYVVGVGVYATHFPESVAPSRLFDVFGSSHQWWHLAVVVAAMQHFHVVLQLWRSAATLGLPDAMAQHGCDKVDWSPAAYMSTTISM